MAILSGTCVFPGSFVSRKNFLCWIDGGYCRMDESNERGDSNHSYSVKRIIAHAECQRQTCDHSLEGTQRLSGEPVGKPLLSLVKAKASLSDPLMDAISQTEAS